MTGNCAALAALADEPGYAQINTADAQRLGIEDEALVCGEFAQRAHHHPRAGQRSSNKGAVYMTYQWWIGACNELVNGEPKPDNQNAGV